MKVRVLAAGLMLAMFTSAAVAGENFVQAFLKRYKPASAYNVAAANAQLVDAAIQTRVRDGILPLTVGDMVQLMLESNLDMRVSRFAPLTSDYLIAAAFRPFEPTLNIGASMNRNTEPSRTQLEGAALASTLNHNYSIGYSQTLKTGTSFGVDFRVTRNSSNSVFSAFNPSYRGTLTYSFIQPLLQGFGRDVNTRGIRVAQNNKEISEVQFANQLINMVTQAQEMYWDLVLSREDIKVKQRSLELAQKTLSDNRRMVEIGVLGPIEVLQAEAEVASREEQLVMTTYNRDQLQDRIKRSITHLSDPAFVLATLNPVEAFQRPSPSDVMPVELAIKYALENRLDMRELELQLRNDDINVQFQENELLPTVNLSGSYTQSGVGGVETLRSGLGGNTIIGVRRGGLVDAFDQMFGYNFTGYSVGFNVSIPLGNKAAQAEYSRVLTQKQLNQSRLATLMQRIALDVRNATSQVEMNRARIQAAERALDLARRQLEAEEKKSQLGVSSIRFVLDEQRRVTVAETSAIQATINYTVALVRYDQAIGRTLRRNNIEIEKQILIAD